MKTYKISFVPFTSVGVKESLKVEKSEQQRIRRAFNKACEIFPFRDGDRVEVDVHGPGDRFEFYIFNKSFTNSTWPKDSITISSEYYKEVGFTQILSELFNPRTNENRN